MARPSKPADVIRSEGKSHRTKAELAAREENEKSVLSGETLFERREVRKNKVAHKEFLRISKLMEKIGKSDALYSSGINTYCELYAEIYELQSDLEKISALVNSTQAAFDQLGEDATVDQLEKVTRQINKLLSQKTSIMSAIDRKRNMMLAIDKENVMTISAALRAIPKTPQDKPNPILDALKGEE